MPVFGSSAAVAGRLSESKQEAVTVVESACPFIPPTVDVKRLKANGKLLTDEEIAVARAKPPGKHKKHTPEAKGVGDFSVIVLEQKEGPNKLFAVYEGKLGKGGFGKVRMGQDLDTGKWHAIKLQEDDVAAKREFQFLQHVEKTSGQVVRTKKPKDKNKKEYQQQIMPMELAQGIDLDKFLKNQEAKLSELEWVRLATQQLTTIYELHQDHILHRDIKTQNFMYDVKTGKLTAIDLGIALEGLKGQSSPENQSSPQGSPHMVAPEIWKEFLMQAKVNAKGEPLHEPKLVTYNEKTEVYSLGLSIAETLGMSAAERSTQRQLQDLPRHLIPYFKNRMKVQDDDEPFSEEAISKIQNHQLRDAIRSYLHKMTSENPADRPTMKEAVEFFKAIELQLLQAASIIKSTAILEVKDFVSANEEQKQQMMASLKTFDEVVFVDSTKSLTSKELLETRVKLEAEGVHVSGRFFTPSGNVQPGSTKWMEEVSQKLRENDEHVVRNCFYLSKGEPFSNAKVCSIDYTKEVSGQVQHYMQHQKLFSDSVLKVVEALQGDIDRLREKYKSKDESVNARIKLVREVIDGIQKAHQKKSMTVAGLHDALVDLETKTSRVTLGFKRATDTSDAIKKVREREVVPHLNAMRSK